MKFVSKGETCDVVIAEITDAEAETLKHYVPGRLHNTAVCLACEASICRECNTFGRVHLPTCSRSPERIREEARREVYANIERGRSLASRGRWGGFSD